MAKQLVPAAGYLRMSTKAVSQQRSIPTQRREIQRFAKAQGYAITQWYEDQGRSGWMRGSQRPEYTKMLADAKEQLFTVVICDDFDRLSRDEFAAFFEDAQELAKAGIDEIWTAKDGRVYNLQSDEMSAMINLLVTSFNSNDFSRKLALRIARARRDQAERGFWTSRPPYGYKLVGPTHQKLPVIVKEQAKIVQLIFRKFAEEGWSRTEIARYLNAKNIPSPRNGKWNISTITHALKHTGYALGYYDYNRRAAAGRFFHVDADGEIVSNKKGNGKHQGKLYRLSLPPILYDVTAKGKYPPSSAKNYERQKRRAMAQWKNTQERLKEKRHAGPTNVVYLFSRLITCSECKRILCAALPERYLSVRYQCPRGGCSVQSGLLESRVRDLILQTIRAEFGDIFAPAHRESDEELRGYFGDENAHDRQMLRQELESLQRKSNNVEKAIEDADSARARKRLCDRLDQLHENIDELEAKLKKIPDYSDGDEWREEYRPYFEQWKAQLESPDDATLNAAMHRLGVKITARWRKFDKTKQRRRPLDIELEMGRIKKIISSEEFDKTASLV